MKSFQCTLIHPRLSNATKKTHRRSHDLGDLTCQNKINETNKQPSLKVGFTANEGMNASTST